MRTLAEVQSEIDAVNVLAAPLQQQIAALHESLRPLDNQLCTLGAELCAIEREAERQRARVDVLPVWEAYLRGERKTIVVAGVDEKRPEVTPLERVDVWVIHVSVASEDWPGYTLTHGPTGLCAYRADTVPALLAIAARLIDVAPGWDGQGVHAEAARIARESREAGL